MAQVNATLSAPTTATPGSDLAYTYKVANAGPATATRLTNTLFLPSGVTLVSASGSPSSSSSAAVQWEPVTMAAGSSVTYTVVVKISTGDTGTLTADIWSYPLTTGSLQPSSATSYAAVSTKV